MRRVSLRRATNSPIDSLYRLMKAYHKVRMYRTDVQGVCDSLVYNSKDSCMTMYVDPILWNEGQQLLGEQIKIYMNDSTIDWAHIINQALTVEMKDSIHYNQVSGKEMKAYFENGDMRHIEVIGNVAAKYAFPRIAKSRSRSVFSKIPWSNTVSAPLVFTPWPTFWSAFLVSICV